MTLVQGKRFGRGEGGFFVELEDLMGRGITGLAHAGVGGEGVGVVGVDAREKGVLGRLATGEGEIESAGLARLIGRGEIPEGDGEGAVIMAGDEEIGGGIGDARCAELVEEGEGVVGGFLDAAGSD